MAATTITAIAAGILAATSAATAGYTIVNSEEQKKKAAAAQAQNEKNANALLDEQQKQTAATQAAIDAESDVDNRNSARNRQKAQAAGAFGRSDTLLTSPGLGTVGGSSAAGGATKTLIGA